MNETRENLSFEIKRLSSELARLEQRLKSESAPDPLILNEFRQVVDNVRLTAWSVSELVNAQWTKKDPNIVLAFLAAERLRRFDQMVRSLCGDIERQAITSQTNGMHSLVDSANMLQRRLAKCFSGCGVDYKVKDAVR